MSARSPGPLFWFLLWVHGTQTAPGHQCVHPWAQAGRGACRRGVWVRLVRVGWCLRASAQAPRRGKEPAVPMPRRPSARLRGAWQF